MMPSRSRCVTPGVYTVVRLVSVALAWAVSTQSASATDYTWISGGGGRFAWSANWSPAGFPNDNTDVAIFDLTGAYAVAFAGPGSFSTVTNRRLEVAAGTVAFDLLREEQFYDDVPQTYRLEPPVTLITVAAMIGTTAGTQARLIVGGGDIFETGMVEAFGVLELGVVAGSSGRLDVGDQSPGGAGRGNWISTYPTWVGVNGTGVLAVDMGTLTDGGAVLGMGDGSLGLATIDIGGTWISNGRLTVGHSGIGLLTLGGGSISVDLDLWVARSGGSVGTISADLGHLDVNGSMFIGGGDQAAGGTGNLFMSGNARVDVVGGFTIWPAGSVSIEGTSVVAVGGALVTQPGSSLELSGGTLQMSETNASFAPATFDWTSGTLSVNAGLTMDSAGILGPALTVGTGMTLDVTDALLIGPDSVSQVNVNGGTITCTSGQIGSTTPGSIAGTVVLSGADASWTMTQDLTVRGDNIADLVVIGLAVLSNDNAMIASPPGTTANIDIADPGTLWSSAGSVYLGGNQTTLGGDGTLAILAGAIMDVAGTLHVWDDFVASNTDGTISAGTIIVNGSLTCNGTSALNFPSGVMGIRGGHVDLAASATMDATSASVVVEGGGTLVSSIIGDGDTQVVVRDSGSSWTALGSLWVGATDQGSGHVGTFALENSGAATVTGDVTVLDIAGFDLGGGTLTAQSVDLLDADFQDFGTINADFSTTGSVAPTGELVLGDLDSYSGVEIGGALDVGAFTVTLRKKGFFTIGNSTSINGGTLIVPNGVALPVGNSLVASGTIQGRMAAQTGSTIEASGTLTLGDATSPAGFLSDAEMYVDDQTVTLEDANEAVLGSLTWLGLGGVGGTLTAANGLIIDFGNNVVGHGIVDTPDDPAAPVINNGAIVGNSAEEPIELTGYIKGVGTLDHVVISGTDAPGFSPVAVRRGSVVYRGSLIIEVGGPVAGTEHDQINHTGMANLGGTLRIELIGGFVPQVGERFVALTFASRSGQFANVTGRGECNGPVFQVEYNEGDVTLVVVDSLPGDADVDGKVSLVDYQQFSNCVTGPGGTVSTGCECFDVDASGTVDLRDYWLVQTAFNGE